MKPYLILLAVFCVHLSHAQTNHLVAHWDMNGSVKDVSGGAHHGTASNVTPAPGKDSIMGHAYYFNGSNSLVSVPYTPDLNLDHFSICARVKVTSFYNGLCQGNAILMRGPATSGVTGCYALAFDNNAYDHNNCYANDITKEVFYGIAGNQAPYDIHDRYYSPNIVTGQWYCVVVTFNDTAYKTYVDGMLVNTTNVSTPGQGMGSSNYGISIGRNTFEGPTWPYPFNGTIDDLRLYNGVLGDNEIALYCETDSLPGDTTIHQDTILALTAYPNPAHDDLYIKDCKGSTLSVFDAMGNELVHELLTEDEQKLYIGNLPKGVYMIRVTGKDAKQMRRILKE